MIPAANTPVPSLGEPSEGHMSSEGVSLPSVGVHTLSGGMQEPREGVTVPSVKMHSP